MKSAAEIMGGIKILQDFYFLTPGLPTSAELCAALKIGVLNVHITDILLNYVLLSGQEYSIFILLLFLLNYVLL